MSQTVSIPSGIWPVLLTPFDVDDRVDEAALEALIEYYIEEQSAGIFAVCASSEILTLTPQEVITLARLTVEFAKGRTSVIATGNIGKSLSEQIEMVKRVADSGVDVVIIATSLLPDKQHLGEQLLNIAEQTNCPLGVYEIPLPVHRTLSVDEVGLIARSGRFHVLKETSRQGPVFLAKVEACRDTPLRVFQANLKTLFATGSEYGHGFMGCLANIAPHLLCQYLNIAHEHSTRHDHLVQFLRTLEAFMNAHRYPASAKYILKCLGLPLTTCCRWPDAKLLDATHLEAMDEFLDQIQSTLVPARLGLRFQMPAESWPELRKRITLPSSVSPAID